MASFLSLHYMIFCSCILMIIETFCNFSFIKPLENLFNMKFLFDVDLVGYFCFISTLICISNKHWYFNVNIVKEILVFHVKPQ